MPDDISPVCDSKFCPGVGLGMRVAAFAGVTPGPMPCIVSGSTAGILPLSARSRLSIGTMRGTVSARSLTLLSRTTVSRSLTSMSPLGSMISSAAAPGTGGGIVFEGGLIDGIFGLPIGGMIGGTFGFADSPRIVLAGTPTDGGGMAGGAVTPGGTGIGGGARPATVENGCFGMSCSVTPGWGTTGETSVFALSRR